MNKNTWLQKWRICGKSSLDSVRSDESRGKVDIEMRQFILFGHVKRVDVDRWPKRSLDWMQPGRQKRGRPRHRWTQGIVEAMMAINLEEGE
jgi:hypothetical protein